MRIHVNEITESGLVVELCENPGRFSMLQELETHTGARYSQPLTIRLELNRMRDMIAMHGRLQSRLEMACGRCLETVTQPVDIEFELYYNSADEVSRYGKAPAVVELTTEDMNQIFYNGEVIEPLDAIEEEAAAAVPQRLLCRSDCRGLCPGCGANLNTDTCTCRPKTDPRLAILAKLKI